MEATWDEVMFCITGTPSTTMRGWLLPLMDLLPRKRILDDPPAPVELGVMTRPALFPWRELIMLMLLMSLTSLPPTVSAA